MPLFLLLLLLFLVVFLWWARPAARRVSGTKNARKAWWQHKPQRGRYVDFEEIPDDGRDDEPQVASRPSTPQPPESRIKDAEFEEIP